MGNIAQDVIVPKGTGIFRTVFLHVGQGDAVLMVIPDGNNYKYILVDCNKDEEKGVDLQALLNDLLPDNKLNVFINTHPHTDHINGLKDIYENVDIEEVWHSGHIPGKAHDEAYQVLKEICEEIGKDKEFVLFGTNDINKIRKSDKITEFINKIGDVDFQVLSPAEYVVDEIADEKPEKRYQRIHEHCAVIRFSYGNPRRHILITGDSDKAAWKEHITDYHKDSLKAHVLSASHHGSRTFFKDSEDDTEPFEDHFNIISPEYLVINAPKQSDSPHDHPHDDAIELYKKKVKMENILHTGKNMECFIYDIPLSGMPELRSDKRLIEHYAYNNSTKENVAAGFRVGIGINKNSSSTRLDDKPMG